MESLSPDEKKQAANSSNPKAESAKTSVSYNELDQHRRYIDSNEGRFMIDITNMGSCISDPPRYFRASTNLDLQKTLTDAFQIYYEEGKLVHEDSVVTPAWGCEPTSQSPTALRNLCADMKKIFLPGENEQKLIQKAIGAIEGRIDRIEWRQKTSGGTLNHGD